MKRKCFIILGMHRSGTSATTGLLSYFDIELGRAVINPNEENPKGFFENKAVLGLNKKILTTANSNWDDYHFNIKSIDPNQIEIWVTEALEILKQEFPDNGNFAIKDPRLCLLFPIWEEALNKYNVNIKVIIVNRHPSAIASSLETRNGFANKKSLLIWAKYSLSLEFFSRAYERLLIQYPTSFINTPELIDELKKFTELSIDETQLQKALVFYENSLTRHKIDQEKLKNDTPPLIAHMSSLLDSGNISQSSKFDLIHKELNMMLNFYSDEQTISKQNAELSKKSTHIRQRNERITRLESEIEEIEIAISHRIENHEKETTELKQQLSETYLEAIQFSNRTARLAKSYLRDRENNGWIKGLYKHKKDKRLIQKINRLQLRLQNKLNEINTAVNEIDEQD